MTGTPTGPRHDEDARPAVVHPHHSGRPGPGGRAPLRIAEGLTDAALADSAGQAWAGRTLRPNPFAGDDGKVQPGMAAALALTDPGERVVAVVAELRTGRVVVPVVAHEHPGTDDDGHVRAHDADRFRTGDRGGDAMASAAMVSVRTADGRSALPVFSSVEALLRWDPAARPVPVEAARAALSAVGESDSLLVLDPGAPTTVLVPRPAVWAVAQQRPWVPSWADPELPGLVAAALRGITELVGVRLERGERAELRVVLAVRAGLDAETVRAAVTRASEALGAEHALRERVDSLELAPTVVA
ncbi:SseB family protein [Georgenia muralis]|uniref:Type III secretion system (T3SS) SseB-like protein n=1 Tax=Georgenia muralis TaxID=154117 RepID=A0A3N4Z6H9_9MICO|nr:SseB family protein [Georgenia muralis]RPF27943.1 type III secretion system (T3SS) SseB-like protein [Georgenia muralis]